MSKISLQEISHREMQILELISNEYNSKEITHRLYISVHTVISHRRNLLRKLKAQNSAGLVRKGFEWGILN